MSIPVTEDNFARAETDRMFAALQDDAGGINRWNHDRVPVAIDHQTVIRIEPRHAVQHRRGGHHQGRCRDDPGRRRALPLGHGRQRGPLHQRRLPSARAARDHRSRLRHAVCRWSRRACSSMRRIPADLAAVGGDPGPARDRGRFRERLPSVATSRRRAWTRHGRCCSIEPRPGSPRSRRSAGAEDVDHDKHLIGTAAGLGRPAGDGGVLHRRPGRPPGDGVPADGPRRPGRRLLVGQRLQRGRLLRAERPRRRTTSTACPARRIRTAR